MRELVAGRVTDDQLEQEPVELRLGQRVGSFLFDRVLGRHHEERLLEHVDVAADRDRVFLHGFEQGRLGLGGGSIDLVGEHDLREDRARLKLEDAAAVGQLHDDVGADDVGRHQVGRELDPVEIERDGVGQGPHQEGLAQARHPFQERVPADKQAGQDAVDDLVVADDDLGDLSLDFLVGRAKFVGTGFHRFGGKGGHRRGSFR